MTASRVIRCAIYTRKSSEEGLEQPFNSLQAQREACEAYIHSQRLEGWTALSTQYDDGGFSGGTMERPGLKNLLADISSGKVDTVVVYKVDRLTRSLSDFAKIVDCLDKKCVSFVSVTQQFNTTSSMGRLTLNVLLSFAQFEREVTGERIRDKIAASKKKGLWMGGRVPLGYKLQGRNLVIHEAEAATVQEIFTNYLKLGSVRHLQVYLSARGLVSKRYRYKSGRYSGGVAFGRGALYHLLSNPVYRGMMSHKKNIYQGNHEPIIDELTWTRVQEQLAAKSARKNKANGGAEVSLLTGLIFDRHGNRFTPTHSLRRGKKYRYYVSQATIRKSNTHFFPSRLPAKVLELSLISRLHQLLRNRIELADVFSSAELSVTETRALLSAAQDWIANWTMSPKLQQEFLTNITSRIVVEQGNITLKLSRGQFWAILTRDEAHESTPEKFNGEFELSIPFRVERRGSDIRLIIRTDQESYSHPNARAIKALARARQWYRRIVSGYVVGFRELGIGLGFNERYVSTIFRFAMLSPTHMRYVVEGKYGETLSHLKVVEMNWKHQRI